MPSVPPPSFRVPPSFLLLGPCAQEAEPTPAPEPPLAKEKMRDPVADFELDSLQQLLGRSKLAQHAFSKYSQARRARAASKGRVACCWREMFLYVFKSRADGARAWLIIVRAQHE